MPRESHRAAIATGTLLVSRVWCLHQAYLEKEKQVTATWVGKQPGNGKQGHAQRKRKIPDINRRSRRSRRASCGHCHNVLAAG